MTMHLLILLGILNALFAVFMPIYYARHIVAYSSIRHTLSELGAIDSPYKRVVAKYYFFPLALGNIFFLVIAYLLFVDLLNNRIPFILMSFVSVGYLLAAFFPCDPGSPMNGSVQNKIHNVGGFFEYIGSGLGLVLLGLSPNNALWGDGWGACLIISGGVILVMLLLLMSPFFQSIRGLVQRIAEYSYFGWMFVFSMSLLF